MEKDRTEMEVMTKQKIASPADVNLASEYARLGAILIDVLIIRVSVLLIVLIMVPTGVLKNFEPMLEGEGFVSIVVELSLGLLVYSAINGHMLATRGQTIGKILMKVRIVDMNNSIPPLPKILFLRFFLIQLVAACGSFGVFLAIVDALFIFRPDRRCLHDRLAGTQVIKA